MLRFSIKSYKWTYEVHTSEELLPIWEKKQSSNLRFIIDEKVFSLYREQFPTFIIPSENAILITASEENKNIDKISSYVDQLSETNVRRDHTLVAIGGGIIQDITCFMASTLFRGMDWELIPTTLLAQADSCIGSKSSINVGKHKNLMGTFVPPKRIHICSKYLRTLEKAEINSGIGEIFKVHMIKGRKFFSNALNDYKQMMESPEILESYILNSLEIKKELIEADEFDKGVRNIMNYGHSYGHAIESATNFGIPHGVAVSIGIDMANYQAYKMGRVSLDTFNVWHNGMKQNYQDFNGTEIPMDVFLEALSKDKKNIGNDLGLIIPMISDSVEKLRVPKDQEFVNNCKEFFEKYYG